MQTDAFARHCRRTATPARRARRADRGGAAAARDLPAPFDQIEAAPGRLDYLACRPGERRRATLRRPRRRHAELVGLLVGALAGWLTVGLAWPQATLRGDTLWLLGVVAGGLAGDGLAQLWRYGAALARRRRRGAGA